MTLGKNPRLSKGGKRNTKKKVGDTMLTKEWYDVVAPEAFTTRHCSKTIVKKSKGTFNAADNLKGRVFEVCLADLMNDNENVQSTGRKVLLKAEEVLGRNVLTTFYGMSLTTDRLRSLVKKLCTIIESTIEVKTSDGYTLRLFVIAFTLKRAGHLRRNWRCQSSHVKKIRQKMTEKVTQFVSKNPLEKVIKNLQQDVMSDDIKKACATIYPVRDVNIRKVKVTKSPKYDIGRVYDAHGGENNIPKSVEGAKTKIAAPAPAPEKAEEADE